MLWVALLDRGGHSTHEGRQLRYHDTLWLPALQHAFPSGPGHQKKTNRGLRTVQSLRNRIGHHEKVFKVPFKDTRLTLPGLHQHCLDVTGWISFDVEVWVPPPAASLQSSPPDPEGTADGVDGGVEPGVASIEPGDGLVCDEPAEQGDEVVAALPVGAAAASNVPVVSPGREEGCQCGLGEVRRARPRLRAKEW